MGRGYQAICEECGHRFQVNDGGGFLFHLLRCDRCGREKTIGFADLGETHLRYLKWLPGPYSIATSEFDERVRREYPGEALPEAEYEAEVENLAGLCECGGLFRFDAHPRCPRCLSDKLREDPTGVEVRYD